MRELTTYEWLFVGEYLADGDATAACKRAGYEGKYARAEGAKLMKLDHIVYQIAKVLNPNKTKPGLTTQDVVADITNVLRADPRDLVEHWQGACRYCYSYDHRYHRTLNEYRRDEETAAMKEQAFDAQGGTGFNPRREPNNDCPECFGEGEPYERIKDTRELTPEQAALYAGVERTKYGIKVLMRSKDAARAAAALYLGMNKQTLDLNTRKAVDLTDDELAAIAKGEAGE